MVIQNISIKNYIHANCGGEIEEIQKLDSLDRILHCLKCDEKWTEEIVIIDSKQKLKTYPQDKTIKI